MPQKLTDTEEFEVADYEYFTALLSKLLTLCSNSATPPCRCQQTRPPQHTIEVEVEDQSHEQPEHLERVRC
jgi:hypothetical protein